MPKRKFSSKPSCGTIHPRNKYAENVPDFGKLALLDPSFKPYVFYGPNGRPRIDWRDFNATRELTRVLLHRDHGIQWWIPDGQLCPTVPNRSNYIHWIEDLLASGIVPKLHNGDEVRGLDIGTGANCIYPLLGAALNGWKFVGTDVTEVALEWAEKNVQNNPHLVDLIEIRKAGELGEGKMEDTEGIQKSQEAPSECLSLKFCNPQFAPDRGNGNESSPIVNSAQAEELCKEHDGSVELFSSTDRHNMDEFLAIQPSDSSDALSKKYKGPPVLLGVIREGEQLDFCMCNPPFFESMEEAGANPRTACGGTVEEMVCPGGEQAFIARIIEDSVKLRGRIRWYTTMVGKKVSLKALTGYLRKVGVTVVQTTEFVQGRTSRWGLAWSFIAPSRKNIVACPATENSKLSFMLEGLQRQCNAFQVLKSIENFFAACSTSCKVDLPSFSVTVMLSERNCEELLNDYMEKYAKRTLDGIGPEATKQHNIVKSHQDGLSLCVSVFEQTPGTLLVKGLLAQKDSSYLGVVFMQRLAIWIWLHRNTSWNIWCLVLLPGGNLKGEIWCEVPTNTLSSGCFNVLQDKFDC